MKESLKNEYLFFFFFTPPCMWLKLHESAVVYQHDLSVINFPRVKRSLNDVIIIC